MNKLFFLPHFTVVFIFIQSNDLQAQVSARIALEGGYYSTANSLSNSNESVEGRIDGRLDFRSQSKSNVTKVSMRVRPEIYGLENSLTSYKLKGLAYHQLSLSKNAIGVGIEGAMNRYSFSNRETTLDYFSIHTTFSRPVASQSFFSAKAGYTVRTNEYDSNLEIDLVFINANYSVNVARRTILGAGIYVERFTSKFEPNAELENFSLSNKGYRFGPLLNFEYQDKMIIKLNYNLMLHLSDVTKNFSAEHFAQVVAAKSLKRNVTLMLLAEYYYGDLRFNESTSFDKYLYFPSNNENEIYGKLVVDVSASTEVYLRTGYFNIDLQVENQSLSGWNMLFGIQTRI